MRCSFVLQLVAFGTGTLLSAAQPVEAAPCKPSQSAAMLTGPVYESILAECNWIDAINRRDAKTAAKLLDSNVQQVDAGGTIQSRAALLAAVAGGRLGSVVMNVEGMTVAFTTGSTNVVISTWTFHKHRHRVTDVFFCDVFHACAYRLIAEQITTVAR